MFSGSLGLYVPVLARLVLPLLTLTQSAGVSACPLLSPDYPIPRQLSNSSTISTASAKLTTFLNAQLQNGTASTSILDRENTSFSIDVYSRYSPQQSLFTYHFSAPSLDQSGEGVTHVDSNSIYRIASITKVLTTYAFLIHAGFGAFNDPITKYVPEVAAAANADAAAHTSAIDAVSWEDVTLGALASQLGGVPRDAAPDAASDLAIQKVGLPPVAHENGSFCAGSVLVQLPCGRQCKFHAIP